MNKMAAAILLMCLMINTSCKKNSAPDGSWSFEGVTYDVVSCTGSTASLNADNVNNTTANANSFGYIGCYFYQALPTTAGTYTVVKAVTASGQVCIALNVSGTQQPYTSTGGNGTETVKISFNNGKMNVTGAGIEMLADGGTDSSTLSLNITQTQ